MSNLGRRRGLSGRARLAWFAVVACPVALGVVGPMDPNRDLGDAVVNGALVFGSLAALLVVGALLVTRVPGNAIGSWLVLAAVLVTVSVLAHVAQAAGAVMEPVPWPGAPWAALLGQLVEIYPIAIVIVIVPLHFPDGRLPSPRWRWVQWVMVLAITAGTVAGLFGPGPYGTAELANPLSIPALGPLTEALGVVALLAAVPAFLGTAASMVVRYRHAGHVERQQMKWLGAVAAIAGIAFPASFIVPNETASAVLYTIGYASLAALPLAIGAAILRYRLYDLDHFISRTVSWTLTSALSVAVFVGGLLALQYLLAGVTQAQTLAVAASTLLAAVLFQPLRLRVQRAVDRRFDRTAVDADRATTEFANRLRDEVDLDTLTQELESMVDNVVRPASSRVWLRHVDAGPTTS